MKRHREPMFPFSAEVNRRRRLRLVQRIEDMSEAEIEAICRSEVPVGHESLDDELGHA